MEVASDIRGWDELIPDTLALIFTKLSLRERLTMIPMVCKSWASAVYGPYCWQEIEITDWSTAFTSIGKMSLRTRKSFTFIAKNAGSLRDLRLPRCNMNDYAITRLTRKLSMISFLDLSYCVKIGSNAIKTIGKNCKQLEVFCWNMHPTYTWGKPFEDAKAYAIASTMSKLKRLEIVYHLITNEGVLKIISSCPKLECLDLRGCWGVKLDTMSVKQNFPKLMVLRPQVLDSDVDEYNYNDDGMWFYEGRVEEL
ncbi:ubiquitin-protein ligase [Medicago truncatula]|uniref:Ubiquitin-protein ligase n=1 Tax=Medicago truncatula TaxID=3880 RepID=G7K512_MEDTR|nr:ubiquitin-protein ligase [Medicago truncatula]